MRMSLHDFPLFGSTNKTRKTSRGSINFLCCWTSLHIHMSCAQLSSPFVPHLIHTLTLMHPK